jgi:hypothetical protein
MGSLQTVLPFKLAVTDESLTAHGGLALFGEYLRAMGVCSLIDHELPSPGSAPGCRPSAHVLPLILMLVGGGRTLEDLRVLRNDEGLRLLLRLTEMPSSDAPGAAPAFTGLHQLNRERDGDGAPRLPQRETMAKCRNGAAMDSGRHDGSSQGLQTPEGV